MSTAGCRIFFEDFGNAPPEGYYQTLGVTADDSRDLEALVAEHVAGDTGGQLLEMDDVAVAELDGRHSDIRECCGDPAVRGVWYSSGRAFYSDSNDDPDEEESDG